MTATSRRSVKVELTAGLLRNVVSRVMGSSDAGYAFTVDHGTIRIFSISHCRICPATVIFRAVSSDRKPRCKVVIEVVIARAMTAAANITSTIVKAHAARVRVNRQADSPALNVFFTPCIFVYIRSWKMFAPVIGCTLKEEFRDAVNVAPF